jgi:tripartite-type tricarboxylate transporter receptor subunit TctC
MTMPIPEITMKRIRFVALLAAAGLVPAASGQPYPAKPVRLISPFPPGGGTDAVARVIATALSDQLGQQVVVDSRGGASGSIGIELATKAAPDGYTLVMGNVIPLAMFPAANPRTPYVPLRDLAPVSLTALTDYTLTVHPSLPAHDIKQLLALARKRPGELTYASSGNFSGPHLSGELLNLMANVRMLHVPYKGTGPAGIAVMSGETTMMFGTGPSVVPHINAGKLRGLASTGAKRSIPTLPTFGEFLPGYEVTQWYGILVPAATPRDIVDRLHRETVSAIANPKVMQVLTNLGTQPLTNSPDEFRSFIKAEGEKWSKVIKAANIRAE